MGDKIVLQEDPPTPNLGSRDAPRLSALPQLFGVHAEKGCGFGKIKRAHQAVCRRTVGASIFAAQRESVTEDSASIQ